MRLRAALGALFVAVPSLASEPLRVALLLPACELPGVGGNELREAVALDLRLEDVVLAPPGELSPGRDVQLLVEASCASPDELILHAELGQERQRRKLRLSELAAEQRPRALSLALTELVSLVLHPSPPLPSPEPQAEPPTPAPPPPPDSAAPIPAKKPPPEPTKTSSGPVSGTLPEDRPTRSRKHAAWYLGVAPQLRFFGGTALWGAQVQLSRARLRYGAGLLMTRTQASSGSVWTRLAHLEAGYGFSLWRSAVGAALESGPRLGVGHTFMSARSTGAATAYDAHDWYLDAAWTARYQLELSGSIRLGLGAELGYGRGPIAYADDVLIAQTSGPFASVTLDGALPL
ncbi:MAG: hypothetical protein EOO73_31365 [Myxococcales bacterium]|nr:MAG: hypothetical protein EOO73_31365 [Myxococcales bacterium]